MLNIPPYIVPPMSATWNEFLRMWCVAALPYHTGITAFEVLVGFILGSLLAVITIGILTPLASRWAARLVRQNTITRLRFSACRTRDTISGLSRSWTW